MLSVAELESVRARVTLFTEELLLALLDAPDAVTVHVDVKPNIIEIEMTFTGSPYDCQRMIGMQGKTINGYRRLLYAIALRHGILRVSVSVTDPWGVKTGEDHDLHQAEFSRPGRRPLSGEEKA